MRNDTSDRPWAPPPYPRGGRYPIMSEWCSWEGDPAGLSRAVSTTSESSEARLAPAWRPQLSRACWAAARSLRRGTRGHFPGPGFRSELLPGRPEAAWRQTGGFAGQWGQCGGWRLGPDCKSAHQGGPDRPQPAMALVTVARPGQAWPATGEFHRHGISRRGVRAAASMGLCRGSLLHPVGSRPPLGPAGHVGFRTAGDRCPQSAAGYEA